MNTIHIFISSVQKEFSKERAGITGEVTGVVTGVVTGEVQRLLTVLVGEMKRTDIQEALALRHEDYFREAYLVPALTAGVIEMTIPGKPTSSKQKFRLTQKGHALIAKLAKEVGGNEE